MTELDKLLKLYNETALDEVGIFELIELLISERRAYLNLIDELNSATSELYDACAYHEIDVCHEKQCEIIRKITGDK